MLGTFPEAFAIGNVGQSLAACAFLALGRHNSLYFRAGVTKK